MIEHEKAAEEFQAGRIDEDEFRRRLSRLGFDPDEADDYIQALGS